MQVKLLNEKHSEQMDRMHRLHEDALEKATAKLSKSLRHREVEYSQLESMHLAVKTELEQRGHDLETKLSKTKEKLKQAEQRRALESEGFTNDVSLLRKQLAAVDRKLHQMRLQSRLEDDERLHSLLQKLEKKGAKGVDQVCVARVWFVNRLIDDSQYRVCHKTVSAEPDASKHAGQRYQRSRKLGKH